METQNPRILLQRREKRLWCCDCHLRSLLLRNPRLETVDASLMASSSAISTAFSPLQVRAAVVSSRSGVYDSSCRRSGGCSRTMPCTALWYHFRGRDWMTMRRQFFLSRCSSASPSDLAVEREISGKTDNGTIDGAICSAKEIRESVFRGNALGLLQEAVISFPPVVAAMKGNAGPRIAIGAFLALIVVVIIVRETVARKARRNHHGSVADLVRRGQLKSHRRGISTPLKYEDPFNNPLVKVNKSKSSVEMCGKVYSLVPLTLTSEERSNHQRRRSRAYQWKRPTFFLKEGDPLPVDIDPDTVRWIPANHPFATTATDMDEDLARSNVHLQSGVPYRVRAEHEALQKKLEAQQRNQTQNLSEEWSSSDDRESDELESTKAVNQRYASQHADLASDSPNKNTTEGPTRF